MKYFVILFFSLIFLPASLYSQEWEVPVERDNKLSPFSFSEQNELSGENLYVLNCKLCHGDPGKGNYQLLEPIPGDPVDSKIQDNSDGSLQYKISEGRGLMPTFKSVLSPEDIWNVISYIRSFNSDYTQSVLVVQQLKDLKWTSIKILLAMDQENNSITATLFGLEGEEWTPVPDTEVKLTVKRYFGQLLIDEPKSTNNHGVVSFIFPDDLPSDRDGNMTFSAMLTNQELFGTISKDTILLGGIKNIAPSLTAERAMWNIGKRAPLWLLITFPAGVFLVWGFIFYVLFQLKAVYAEGNSDEEL